MVDFKVLNVKKFKFNTFLFDVDGTVFLSEKSHFFSFKKVLESFGFSISEKFFFEEALGMNSFQIFKRITSFSDDKIFELINLRNKVFLEEFCDSIGFVKGAFEFVSFLKDEGFKIAFVSNGTMITSACMLKKLRSDVSFPLFSSDEIVNPKPDPEGYFKALSFLGSSSDKSVIFEDTVSGVKAGVSSGCRVVGVKTFRNSESELLDSGADIVIESFFDDKLFDFLLEK